MNHEAVCRTAPATQGLLKTYQIMITYSKVGKNFIECEGYNCDLSGDISVSVCVLAHQILLISGMHKTYL